MGVDGMNEERPLHVVNEGDEPTPPPTLNGSVGDAAALIAAVATLVSGSTATIMARLEENSRGATERWRLHDEELGRNRTAITAKFEKIERELEAEIKRVEQALEAHLVVANVHFQREHDDDLVLRARIQPVKSGVAWLIANWKTVALFVALLVSWILLGVESIEHVITP